MLPIRLALPVLACLPLSVGALTLDEVETLFATAQIVSGPERVDCTLSGGAEASCFQITVIPEPTTYTVGPFCPGNIDVGPDAAGIWFYEGQAIDADGAFFQNLATLYNDDGWQVFDPDTGEISVTDSQVACEAAARPNVDEAYFNHCVECAIEYYPDTEVTYTIPLDPVASDDTADIRQTGAGVAINGIRIDGPAPVDAILSAYTIATFDDCGGHVNPHVGYHYHAIAGDCLTDGDHGHTHEEDDHAQTVGIALDGYLIMSHLNVDGSSPENLDACYGHETDEAGYHYHVGAAGTNQNLGCLSAQTGCSTGEAGAACDASAIPTRPRP